MNQNEQPAITASFNIGLFLFAVFLSGFEYIMTSDEARNAHPVGLIMSIVFDACIVLPVLVIVAALFKAFWDRLVSNIANLREMDYQEALAVVLMLNILK